MPRLSLACHVCHFPAQGPQLLDLAFGKEAFQALRPYFRRAGQGVCLAWRAAADARPTGHSIWVAHCGAVAATEGCTRLPARSLMTYVPP